MFLKNDVVKINPYFMRQWQNMTFLGFIPFGNIDYAASIIQFRLKKKLRLKILLWTMYRLFFLGCPDIWSEQEISARTYIEEHIKNKTRAKKDKTKKLTEEEISHYELVLENRKNKPFVLFFVGGDDQSSFLRFADQNEAKEYLEMADCLKIYSAIQKSILLTYYLRKFRCKKRGFSASFLFLMINLQSLQYLNAYAQYGDF